MTYDNADFGQVGKRFFKIVGKTLCGGAHCVDVHTVGTGTHDAAKTACTEFEIFIETFDEFCLVVSVEHALNVFTGFCVVILAQPLLCLGSYLRKKFVIFHVSSKIFKSRKEICLI